MGSLDTNSFVSSLSTEKKIDICTDEGFQNNDVMFSGKNKFKGFYPCFQKSRVLCLITII